MEIFTEANKLVDKYSYLWPVYFSGGTGVYVAYASDNYLLALPFLAGSGYLYYRLYRDRQKAAGPHSTFGEHIAGNLLRNKHITDTLTLTSTYSKV